MNTAILVIGVHRSGTSATTGALRLAGVCLGDELLEPGQDNPKGYWENTRAVAIHEELLAALDRSWDDVRPLPDGWQASTAAARARAQIHELIDHSFAKEPLWAVKDPRLCRFLPLWKEVLADRRVRTVAMVVARHPDEVAVSIEKRNGWQRGVGKLLWLRYMSEAEAGVRDLPRAVLTYNGLLADPVHALWTAADRIGLEFPTQEALSAELIEQFIDAGDRHYVHASPEQLSPFDQALFDSYRALENIERERAPWEPLGQHLLTAFDAIAAAQAQIDGLAAVAHTWQMRQIAAAEEGARYRSDLLAQIRWSEEAVEREESLQKALYEAQSKARETHQQLEVLRTVAERVEHLSEDERALAMERLARIDALEQATQALSHERDVARLERSEEQARADAAEAERLRLLALTEQQQETLRLAEVVSAELRNSKAVMEAQGGEVVRAMQRLCDAEKAKADTAESERDRLVSLSEQARSAEKARADLAVSEHLRMAELSEQLQQTLRLADSAVEDLRSTNATLEARNVQMSLALEGLHADNREMLEQNERAAQQSQSVFNEMRERHLAMAAQYDDAISANAQLETNIRKLIEDNAELLRQRHLLEMDAEAIRRSFAWRSTAPFRRTMTFMRRILGMAHG